MSLDHKFRGSYTTSNITTNPGACKIANYGDKEVILHVGPEGAVGLVYTDATTTPTALTTAHYLPPGWVGAINTKRALWIKLWPGSASASCSFVSTRPYVAA
jgi:hypothetical protein